MTYHEGDGLLKALDVERWSRSQAAAAIARFGPATPSEDSRILEAMEVHRHPTRRGPT